MTSFEIIMIIIIIINTSLSFAQRVTFTYHEYDGDNNILMNCTVKKIIGEYLSKVQVTKDNVEFYSYDQFNRTGKLFINTISILFLNCRRIHFCPWCDIHDQPITWSICHFSSEQGD